jgi:flavodoxin short chain
MAKVLVVFWSGTGNTEQMAELIRKGASAPDVEVVCKSVGSSKPSEVADYDIILMGSPAMGAEVIEEAEMEPFVESAIPDLKGKKVGLFGSYGWGDGEWMRAWADRMKGAGITLIDDGLIVHETPDDASAAACEEWGKKAVS